MGWGQRLKDRARALGLTDAEVARGLGLSQGRYSAYCNESREPNLALFVRVCRFLNTTPDIILGVKEIPSGRELLTADILGYLQQLDTAGLTMIRTALQAIVLIPDADKLPVTGGPEQKASDGKAGGDS